MNDRHDLDRLIEPREHLTEGVTRERLKMELRRSVRPTGFFLIGLALALAIAGWFVPKMSETIGRDTYEVRFEVGDTFGVFEGFDDVRFRGVPAGTISKIERRGTQLVVVAKIRDEFGPVYRDARAEVRPITPLNDVYLDIVDPGAAAAGEATADEPLAERQTATSVTVPDVLDGLDDDARTGLARLLDQLGNGMADGGDGLRRSFVSLVPFLRNAGELSRQVASREDATRRLVHNTAILTRELGRRETELRRLVATGSATLGTLQQHEGDLDATLAELGPTFTEMRASLAAVRGIVDDVDTGVTSLYPVADALPAGLRATRSLSDDLAPAARALREPVRGFNRWIGGVDLVGDRAGPALARLLEEVPTLDRLTQRLVDCETGFVGFWQWNSSLSKFGDENGPIPRGNLALGAADSGTPGSPARPPAQACTPGAPIRGGTSTPEDEH